MPKPEGYRKALRAIADGGQVQPSSHHLAGYAGRVSGIGRRGAAGRPEAIARNLREMARLSVPVVVVCIGEGGSGGPWPWGSGTSS